MRTLAKATGLFVSASIRVPEMLPSEALFCDHTDGMAKKRMAEMISIFFILSCCLIAATKIIYPLAISKQNRLTLFFYRQT
jgi:hypothetical protein